jgi:hypothetical protein
LERKGKNDTSVATLQDLPIIPEGEEYRSRGRNFDIIEHAQKRIMRGSLINPLFVLKASLANIDKPIAENKKVLKLLKDKLETIKSKQNQIKTICLECLDFFLANPSFLEKLKNTKLTL